MVSALIFAGGIGQRMKSLDIPKQFLEIEGKPIIVRTMEHFSNHPMVDNIVVVCVENWLDVLNQDIEKFGIKKVIKTVPGGATGYNSIHNGLLEVAKVASDDDIVLICDGVRPMLSEDLITTCIEDARKYESAVPVTPSIDSVLYSEDGENCNKNYERRKMFITQAPPSVPGIPAANSNPVSSASNALFAIIESSAPACAWICAPSTFT